MEDQGKRLLLAVVLALGIVVAWNLLFPSEKPKSKPPEATDTTAQKQLESPVTQVPVAPPVVGVNEKELEDRLPYPNLVVTFSRQDARLVHWQLTDPKYQRDWS